MHDTAQLTGNAFFRIYGDRIKTPRILDVGSMNVNGTLREFAPKDSVYTGMDLSPGPDVDVVLDDPTRFPFDNESFDLIISTSCLEHDPMFWMTFKEMFRVLVPGGVIYISAPSNGPYHGYPGDCWRFYQDAAPALVKWIEHNGGEIELIENFSQMPMKDIWIDRVMVFGKVPLVLSDNSIQKFIYNAL